MLKSLRKNMGIEHYKPLAKRCISITVLLSLIMTILCFSPYIPVDAKVTKNQLPEEITRAISYGFVPKEIQTNLSSTITYEQYCKMLTNMIVFYDKTKLTALNKYIKLAAKSKQLMKREDGILTIYYASLAMDLGYTENNFSNSDYTLWNTINNMTGDAVWKEFSWKYPLFPNWDKDYYYGGNYLTTAYFFSIAQYSRISGKTLFDFDEKNKTVHAGLPFTRLDAINSVTRLYESCGKFEPHERTKTTWDNNFFTSYENRLKGILDSNNNIVKSDIYIPGKTYTGTAYYISASGSDSNDGLTQDTPWKTLEKARQTVKSNDAVFLKRNDVWREELNCVEGVTYSAYGTGKKPQIYGSPENGASADKWILWYQDKAGVKIWRFYKDVLDCGGIVFNDGSSYASRVFSHWDGRKYVYLRNPKVEFSIVDGLTHNLQFYSTFDASQYTTPIMTFSVDTHGPLYLRCDEGNPGLLYQSIEFQTAAKAGDGYDGLIRAAKGCVIDNLCAKYGSCRGIGTYIKDNILIQNCEVAWIGGTSLEMDINNYHQGAGEGIGIEGSYNCAINCYVHDCWDGGIISESDFPYYQEGQTIEGNIIERCMSGVLVISHKKDNLTDPAYGNMKINNNYIMYCGYGWSCNPNYDFGHNGTTYLGNSIFFWDDKPYINSGITISNNILYLSKSALIRSDLDKKYWPVMENNTYIQNQHGVIGAINLIIGCSSKSSHSQTFVRDTLGDKTGIVIESN